MDKAIIEKTAVNILERALLKTGRTDPKIKSGDTTPSWDGEIIVYRGEKQEKEEIEGVIPVQVKGKWTDGKKPGKAKYSVDVRDLQNYMRDGGVLFFLVLLSGDDDYKIYYNMLLPYDLRKLIESSKGQKSKTITLEDFPHRYKNGMCNILESFLMHRERQGKLLPNISSIHDVFESGMEVESFEIVAPLPEIGGDSAKEDDWLFGSQYIYAQPRGVEASFVVDKVPIEEVGITYKKPIVIDKRELFDRYTIRERSDGGRELVLGSSIKWPLIPGNKVRFDINDDGILQEKISEMRLLMALANGEKITLESIEIGEIADKNRTLVKRNLEKRLHYLERLALTLDKLHVKKKLSLGRLTEREVKGLNLLASAIIDNKPVPLSVNGKGGTGVMSFGNIRVMLCCKKARKEGSNYVTDFFASNDVKIVTDEMTSKKGVKASPYVVLTEPDYELIDNVDYGLMADSMVAVPYTPQYGAKAVWTLLELLKHYDKIRTHDEAILDAATKIEKYLYEHDKDGADAHRINLLQIEKRRRELTSEENRFLLSVKANSNAVSFQLAASILLESFTEAELLFESMDEKQRAEFEVYPLMNLWPNHTSKSIKTIDAQA